MSKQIRRCSDHTSEPVPSSLRLLSKSLELASCPFGEEGVDPKKGGIQRRFVELTVVVDPATDIWIEHPCQVVQRLVAPGLQGPSPDRLPYSLQCRGARRREKGDFEQPTTPLRQSRPEGVAKKVELDDRVSTFAVGILAVDDLCLLRVKNKTTLSRSRSSIWRNARASRSEWQWQMMSSAYRSNGTPGQTRFSRHQKRSAETGWPEEG